MGIRRWTNGMVHHECVCFIVGGRYSQDDDGNVLENSYESFIVVTVLLSLL